MNYSYHWLISTLYKLRATSEYLSTSFSYVGVLWRTRYITIVAVLIYIKWLKWAGILKFSHKLLCHAWVSCVETINTPTFSLCLSLYVNGYATTLLQCSTGSWHFFLKNIIFWQRLRMVAYMKLFCFIRNFLFNLVWFRLWEDFHLKVKL